MKLALTLLCAGILSGCALQNNSQSNPASAKFDSPVLLHRSDSTTSVVASQLSLNEGERLTIRGIIRDYYREVAQVNAAHKAADSKAPDYFDDYEVQLAALRKVYRDKIVAAFPDKADLYLQNQVVLVK